MIMNHNRFALPVLSLVAAATMGGCVISVSESGGQRGDGYRNVSTGDLNEMIRENREIRLGDDKSSVLDRYEAENTTLKTSAKVNGTLIEEWRVRAQDRSKPRYFERWYYFVDGALVELSDDRVDFREDDATLSRWAKQGD